MDLPDRLLLTLQTRPGTRAKELAWALEVPRSRVNRMLYGVLKDRVEKDSDHRWWPVGFEKEGELSNAHSMVLEALGEAIQVPPKNVPNSRPLDLVLGKPLFLQLRLYLFSLKGPGRSGSRAYINLTLGDDTTADDLAFDRRDGFRPILMGFDLADEVFVLFDADLYDLDGGFKYNRFCYVDSGLLLRAVATGVVYEQRSLRAPKVTETVIVCRAGNLLEAVAQRYEQTIRRLAEAN